MMSVVRNDDCLIIDIGKRGKREGERAGIEMNDEILLRGLKGMDIFLPRCHNWLVGWLVDGLMAGWYWYC